MFKLGQTNAKLRELEGKIEDLYAQLRDLKEKGASKGELVDKARQIPQEVTHTIGSMIKKDYDHINNAIQTLDRKAVNFPDLKHKLQELKKDVPFVYKLPKDLQKSIIEEINKILGTNKSS